MIVCKQDVTLTFIQQKTMADYGCWIEKQMSKIKRGCVSYSWFEKYLRLTICLFTIQQLRPKDDEVVRVELLKYTKVNKWKNWPCQMATNGWNSRYFHVIHLYNFNKKKKISKTILSAFLKNKTDKSLQFFSCRLFSFVQGISERTQSWG